MRKHPVGTAVFIFLYDAVAIIVAGSSLLNMEAFPLRVWITFIIWTMLLCISRIGGMFKLIGVNAKTGWNTSVEVASVLILPFPLFCISVLVTYILVVMKRIQQKHPKPLLEPDFNTSNTILSGYVTVEVFKKIVLMLSNTIFSTIVPLIVATLVYGTVEIMLLTALISIDEGKSWLKVGTIEADSLITEAVLVLTGALIGRVYLLDPFLILLMLILLLMHHNTLGRVNGEKLIYIDEKTGLNNYRYYDEKLNELFEKAKGSKQSLALIFGDIDYLRNINNTYGHHVGDKALIAIANIIKEFKPPNSVAARFGGEEFVVLIPGYCKKQAADTAEIIRTKIECNSILLENGEEIQVTMSFGVASYPEDAGSIEQLGRASDEAVYEAKRLGRNKVVMHNNTIPKNSIKECQEYRK